MDVESELKNYVKGAPLFIVHRLDQPVEGILVFAKTKAAAGFLSKQLGSDEMNKSYLAVVCGDMPEEGTIKDYLRKEPKGNLSKVVSEKEADAKYAELSYKVLGEKRLADAGSRIALPDDVLTLLHIRLKTGRHHQIRVQLANAGHPLLADHKYAGQEVMRISQELGIRDVALCARSLHFIHPTSKQKVEFQMEPKGLAFRLFRDIL